MVVVLVVLVVVVVIQKSLDFEYEWWLGALSIGPRIFEYVCI